MVTFELATAEGPVSAVLHGTDAPTLPGVLLTHGAGGDLDDAGLVALAEGLAAGGAPTVRCNLPFRQRGSARPPRADRAVPGLRDVVASARSVLDTPMLVVGGKSYGGRVASLAVADGLAADGLLFYGYPLHRPGRPEQLRVAHWPDIRVPSLFLQGDRDALCDLPSLEEHLPRLGAEPTLTVVAGGDHSLHVTKRASEDDRVHRPDEVLAGLAGSTVVPWLQHLVERRVGG